MSAVAQQRSDEVRATVAAAAGSVSTHGRRPLPGVLLVAVLLVLLAAAGGVAVRPTLGGSASPRFGAGTLVTELPGYGPRGSYVLAYEDGGYGQLIVEVTNDRPVPVTITSVALSREARSLAPVASASLEGEGLPATLAPGASGAVSVTVRFDHCDYYHERAIEILDRVHLATRTLGVSATAAVALDRPILVRSPMIVDCPDRVLDRQAKTRTGG